MSADTSFPQYPPMRSGMRSQDPSDAISQAFSVQISTYAERMVSKGRSLRTIFIIFSFSPLPSRSECG